MNSQCPLRPEGVWENCRSTACHSSNPDGEIPQRSPKLEHYELTSGALDVHETEDWRTKYYDYRGHTQSAPDAIRWEHHFIGL